MQLSSSFSWTQSQWFAHLRKKLNSLHICGCVCLRIHGHKQVHTAADRRHGYLASCFQIDSSMNWMDLARTLDHILDYLQAPSSFPFLPLNWTGFGFVFVWIAWGAPFCRKWLDCSLAKGERASTWGNAMWMDPCWKLVNLDLHVAWHVYVPIDINFVQSRLVIKSCFAFLYSKQIFDKLKESFVIHLFHLSSLGTNNLQADGSVPFKHQPTFWSCWRGPGLLSDEHRKFDSKQARLFPGSTTLHLCFGLLASLVSRHIVTYRYF